MKNMIIAFVLMLGLFAIVGTSFVFATNQQNSLTLNSINNQNNDLTLSRINNQQNTLTLTGISCGLSLNTSSISYGNVISNTDSAEFHVEVNNTGNLNSSVFIKGTDWVSGINIMPVNSTAFSNVTGDFDSKTLLNTTDQLHFQNLQALGSLNSYLQLRVPLYQNMGSYNGTLTYSIIC